MKKLTLTMGILISLALIAMLMLDDTSTLPSSVDTTVHVADKSSTRKSGSGTFVGFADIHDTHAWLGIPFAEAPVSDLRWRAPLPVSPSDKPLQALAYQPPCVQYWNPLTGVAGEEGEVVGSEDCLHLNVWAPAFEQEAVPKGDQRLPVMVWIHGGGNTIGTANTYQGHHLASDQKIIFVALNYRLGVLGWFGHEAIRNTSASPEDASGNYGVLDMIAGLQWVKDNISAFGGDPNNVTIFGESAGGRNVYALLGSPLAGGYSIRPLCRAVRHQP
ncbi:carboxylesterase family protein [Oceanicoccus sp. KOV_DT_Chl]|uniref:carboxylesterase family protein n=1 Tax=Oceanicoccus sp. KOV_DT_Chl TaxID=1904639 RepID=UPI00190ED7AA|nr:carboxylesterase family protein [Oceanicoccus sp. KOV_DT_Chl]